MSLPKCLAVALASSLAVPAMAGVSGTLHINAGSSRQSISLVPDKQVDFDADSPPESLPFQQSFTTGDPPEITYGRNANATMDGEEGWLSGHVDAELDGIPPTSSPSLGIYGEADLRGSDYFVITSDVLDDGTEVELAFSMVVEGNGRVSSRMYVDRIETNGGRDHKLSLSYDDNGGGGVTGDPDGSFVAKVGELYGIDYSLLVSGGLTTFGLSDAHPTKFIVSDYPNAHYYGAPVESVGVVLDTNSGHDYTPAPEPSGTSAPLAALAMLGGQRVGARTRSAAPG